MHRYPVILWLVFLLAACRQTGESLRAPAPNDYAEFFEINRLDKKNVLKVKEIYPGGKAQIIVLSHEEPSARSKDTIYIKIPVESYITTSVTHLQSLKSLGVIHLMKAFPNTDYIADPDILKRVRQGLITDIGSPNAMDTEKVFAINPDVIFVFGSGPRDKSYDLLEQNGIKVVYVAEWMETHPLGRAEWIKFFGLFFDKKSTADSIYQHIKSRYGQWTVRNADTLQRPKIFQGGRYGDKWYVPGGKSWVARLIHDAGGQYLITNNETASTLLNNEQALLLLEQADIWINPGTWTSFTRLEEEFPPVRQFKVFKHKKIYSAYIKTNDFGKNEYFEKSVLYPDKLLEDYRSIFSENYPKNELNFMQALPE